MSLELDALSKVLEKYKNLTITVMNHLEVQSKKLVELETRIRELELQLQCTKMR